MSLTESPPARVDLTSHLRQPARSLAQTEARPNTAQHLGLVDLATHVLREIVLGIVRQPASRHLGAMAKLPPRLVLRACSSGEMPMVPPDHHAPAESGG